jgi:hypothetical protein
LAAYNVVMDASIAFLRQNQVPANRVAGDEWNHWINSGGTVDTWLPLRPLPSRTASVLTPLERDELRRVAQLWAEPDSNVLFVRQGDDGRFVAVIDAKWSDDDPTRSQSDWISAESLHDPFTEIGLNQQALPYWCDPGLEPFFPLPRPSV